MEIQDRGPYFRVDGKSLDDKEGFRKLVVDVIEANVNAVGVEEVERRAPIAQKNGLVAYPPYRDDTYFCLITDGEDEWTAEQRMELVHLLQRI